MNNYLHKSKVIPASRLATIAHRNTSPVRSEEKSAKKIKKDLEKRGIPSKVKIERISGQKHFVTEVDASYTNYQNPEKVLIVPNMDIDEDNNSHIGIIKPSKFDRI